MRLNSKRSIGRWILVAALVLAGCSPHREPEVVEGRPRDPLAKSGGAASSVQAAADEKDIRDLFDRYWRAMAERQGEQVVACFDRKTLEWYEGVRQDALRMPSDDLRKENLHRRLSILLFRHEFDRDTLSRLSGKELLAKRHARSRREQEAAQKEKAVLSFVGSNGKSAYATVPPNTDKPALFFELEGDGWKLDETRLHETVLNDLQGLCKNSGLDEDSFLLKYLSDHTGRKADERILDGPLEKIPG